EAGAGQVALHWNGVDGATAYDVYKSPVTGGGYVKVNDAPVNGTSFTDTAAVNGKLVYYVVRALDSAGNASAESNEVSATPHLVIGYAVLQYPKTIDETISATPVTVYGQVYIAGATDRGDVSAIRAQVGFGPVGSNPDTWTTWIEAAYNPGHTGDNNAEYQAGVLFPAPGSYAYLYRFTDDGGASLPVGELCGGLRTGGAAVGDRCVHGHCARDDRRDRACRLHRGDARSARSAGTRLGSRRRRAHAHRRRALADHAARPGGDPARVQVHARRLGPRRKGRRVR